jgi:hypothetical protein
MDLFFTWVRFSLLFASYGAIRYLPTSEHLGRDIQRLRELALDVLSCELRLMA